MSDPSRTTEANLRARYWLTDKGMAATEEHAATLRTCPYCGDPVTRPENTYCSVRCANKHTGHLRKPQPATGCGVRDHRGHHCNAEVVDPNPAGVPLCAAHVAERDRLLTANRCDLCGNPLAPHLGAICDDCAETWERTEQELDA